MVSHVSYLPKLAPSHSWLLTTLFWAFAVNPIVAGGSIDTEFSYPLNDIVTDLINDFISHSSFLIAKEF